MTGASIEASGRNMKETLKIKLILCPIDFSEFSVSAYQHALSVAEHYQAKLVAQHIVELWRLMGTHGRRGFDRLMLGSVTDRVMRTAPCPVLAASKPPHGSVAAGKERGHVHHLSRILFCADFSENSERALRYAISATAEYDAELTLLHVLDGVPSSAKTEEATAAAAERLDQLIPPEGRKSLKIRTAARIGKPYAQIIQLAMEAQIDLVIMGVRGRGALDVAVFGSTTYRVMQLGSCPVLAVRS